MRSRHLILATAAALTLALSGCSGGSSGDGLAGALEQTPAGIGAEQEFYYSDIAAAHDLGTFQGKQPYATAAYGLGGLANVSAKFPELIPTDSAETATAISVGRAPKTSFRFTGVDQAGVEKRFGAAEGERSQVADGTLLVQREDLALDMQDELAQNVQAQLNTVWYADDVLVGSSVKANAVAWTADGESLADAGTYDGAAECLGDNVVGAMLSADAGTIPAGTTAFATATTGTTADDWNDVLCLRADDADQLAAKVNTALAEGQSQQSRRPWSDILGQTTAESVGDNWVKVVNTKTPSAFSKAYQVKDLGSLVG